MKDTPPVKLSFALLAGVLTVAGLSQASLSAQASALLFGHDYEVRDFGIFPEDAISATRPASAAQTGAFQLGQVARIDSVSIELSHSWRANLIFSLTAPDGNVFEFMRRSDYLSGDGVRPDGILGAGGGGSFQDLATFTFTESTGPLFSAVANLITPAGSYQAPTWQSAPTGGWAPGVWTLLLGDRVAGDTGAVRRIEVRGVVPEPSAYALLAGLCAFAGVALRRRPVSQADQR